MNYKTKQILKYIIKNNDKDITADELKRKFKLSHMDLVKLTREPYNDDLIVITKDNKVFTTKYTQYYLNDIKLNYFKNLLSRLLWSLIIPVATSFITTLITLILTEKLQVK